MGVDISKATTVKPSPTGAPSSAETAIVAASTLLSTAILPGRPAGAATSMAAAAALLSTGINKLTTEPKAAAAVLTAAAVFHAVVDAITETPKERETRIAKEEEAKKAEMALKAEQKKKDDEALAKKQDEVDKLARENEKLVAALNYQRRKEFNRTGVMQVGDPLQSSDYTASAALNSSKDGKA